MAVTMQHVMVKGYLPRDPETKTFGDNSKMIKFSVAVSEKAKEGFKTEWFNVVCFGYTVEKVEDLNLTKGCVAYVDGKLSTNEKNDKKYTSLIANNVFLCAPPKDKGESSSRHEYETRREKTIQPGRQQQEEEEQMTKSTPDFSDDIPF